MLILEAEGGAPSPGGSQPQGISAILTRTLTTIATILTVSLPFACAQLPSLAILEAMDNRHDAVSCAQAGQTLNQERPKLAALMQKQKTAWTGDAISVFLLLIPVSSLTGINIAAELAAGLVTVNALKAQLAS